MVAELIKKNRQLTRQVATLSARAEKSRSGKSVERGIRTLQRRVKKALSSAPTKRRRTAPANGRRKRGTTTRRRRKA
jgi:hypothetical protein